MFGTSAGNNNGIFNYDQLKLIEKPESPRNARQLPQTLQGCKGYMKQLALLPPNVDQKIPSTVASMINILALPEASSQLSASLTNAAKTDTQRSEGQPAPVYDSDTPVMKALLKAANSRTCHARAPGIFGHVVFPGCVSFYKIEGKCYAVSPGRWALMSMKAKWFAKNVSLNVDQIAPSDSTVFIIRISPGSVGRIRDQGVEHLLDVGTHVFNSGNVSNMGTVEYAAYSHIPHGRYNYVRVPRGKFARVWAEVSHTQGGGRNGEDKSVQPRLLQEGEHCIDSYLFKYSGLSDVSDEYISHGSIHRISIQKGFVGKVWQDNTPRLLGEGDHVIESTAFTFDGTESILSNLCIVHGTITIMRVTLGQIALAWQDNEPVFFDEPGLLEFDSPDFAFVEFKDAEEQLIQLGAKKTILVHTGQVGVTYDEGRLQIMYSGRHVIGSATHIFHRFLSTQQRSIRLATLNAGEKLARQQSGRTTAGQRYSSKSMTKRQTRSSNKDTKKEDDEVDKELENLFTRDTMVSDRDADLTVCETKDLVKVGMRADVFYSIEDPEKCIQKIDTDELEDLVRETAVATLTNIIRSTALNEIAQSKNVSVRTTTGGIQILAPPEGNPAPTAPAAVFFEKVHDEFLSKLNEDFMERYGVDIANIRIESFKIMDEELSEQISRHALTTAQIENEMANLEGKSLISTTQERTAAEVKNINAEAAAMSEKTIADAENKRKVDAALASAESHKIAARAKAEAESEAILMKARAEAESIRLKATAEAERAEVLSRTVLGQQEALLSQYAQMVVESNRGVEKIIYLDPSVNRESPFALGSLQNLNNDLHSLTQVGIASNQATSKYGEKD